MGTSFATDSKVLVGSYIYLREACRTDPSLVHCQHDFMVTNHDSKKHCCPIDVSQVKDLALFDLENGCYTSINPKGWSPYV